MRRGISEPVVLWEIRPMRKNEMRNGFIPGGGESGLSSVATPQIALAPPLSEPSRQQSKQG